MLQKLHSVELSKISFGPYRERSTCIVWGRRSCRSSSPVPLVWSYHSGRGNTSKGTISPAHLL